MSETDEDDTVQTGPGGAEPPRGPTRRFRFKADGSDKFWEIRVDGSSYVVRFGRAATAGQEKDKSFATPEAAQAAADKLIAEKTRKGYVETTDSTEPLTTDDFWKLIERSRTTDPEEQAERLQEALSAQPEDAILDFGRIFDERMAQAYRWDLWGAAFVINEGCSDDGFEYFLAWLIGQGREYYEAALADPEKAGARARPGEMAENESLMYAAVQAYENRTGRDDFHDRVTKVPRAEPAGEGWAEEDLPRLFPKLAKRFGTQ